MVGLQILYLSFSSYFFKMYFNASALKVVIFIACLVAIDRMNLMEFICLSTQMTDLAPLEINS